MAQYQFLNYRFDTDSFHLLNNESRVDIRPKTAQLLAYLLNHRDRTLAKKELFQAVWQSQHVQDHTLFQLISEIRKLAPSQELIRTQPNIGYRWVVNTQPVKPKSPLSKFRIAASIVAISLVTSAVGLSLNLSQPKQFLSEQNLENELSSPSLQFTSETSLALPALSAYSKGAMALENGQHQQAEEWLRFALSENPESAETQLLLAESLYLQDEFAAAEHQLRLLLEHSYSSAYISSAASDLLSRLYQKQGSLFDALTYALNGTDLLDSTQSQCTYEVLDQRVHALKKLIEEQSTQPISSELIANLPGQKPLQSATPEVDSKDQNIKPAGPKNDSLEDCEKIQSTDKNEDLSACSQQGDYPQWASNRLYFRTENFS